PLNRRDSTPPWTSLRKGACSGSIHEPTPPAPSDVAAAQIGRGRSFRSSCSQVSTTLVASVGDQRAPRRVPQVCACGFFLPSTPLVAQPSLFSPTADSRRLKSSPSGWF